MPRMTPSLLALSVAWLATLGATGCEPTSNDGASSGQSASRSTPPTNDASTEDRSGAESMFTVTAAEAREHGLPAATIRLDVQSPLSGSKLTGEHRYLTLSGPPGGPFGLVIDAVKTGSTEQDLRNVAELRFENKDLEIGSYAMINFAGADRPAITCTAGQEMARAHHLLALIEAPGDHTLLVDFQIGRAVDPTPEPAGVLDRDVAGPLLRSLEVEFE